MMDTCLAKDPSTEFCINNPSPISVTLIPPFNPAGPGGLEGYTRRLAAALAGDGSGGQIALPDCDLWNARTVRLLPLMTRPNLRWMARRYAEWAGRRECDALLQEADVVHFVGTGWHLLGFPLAKAAKRRGIPITCWPAVHPGSWGDAPLDIDLYKRVDAVFVQSNYERDHLKRLGVPHKKLVRCGCAAPEETPGNGKHFRKLHRLGDKPVVLFVGRRDRGKGYHALREAIGHIHASGQPIIFVSIGKASETEYPSLPPEIDLDLGAANDATKHDALDACDVFALPSAAESFGIVYVEAWAYGKPVLCGTAPASRELVLRHGGGLVSNGEPGDIADKLAALLNDPSRRQQLGMAGEQAVRKNYTMENVVHTHFDTWARLRGTVKNA